MKGTYSGFLSFRTATTDGQKLINDEWRTQNSVAFLSLLLIRASCITMRHILTTPSFLVAHLQLERQVDPRRNHLGRYRRNTFEISLSK